MVDQEIRPGVEQAGVARCGFRRCRQALPPPGPRGGRPYEFCPERTWPGGKSCKQLAGAESALREALGEDGVPTAALRDAGEAFGNAAAAAAEPLRTLSNALDTITARLREEVTTAVARAEAAEQAAREADRQRDEASAKAETAEAAARDAVAEARAAEEAREAAEATAEGAVAARAEAQLEQARAEATAQAVAERAAKAAEEAGAYRERVDELRERVAELTADVAARAEELSGRTAERDAARTALQEVQEQSKSVERLLTAQNVELTTELEAVGTRLRESDARNQHLLAEHHVRDAELRSRIGEVRTELVSARGQVDTVSAQLAQSTADRDHVTGLLSRVRRRALAAAAEPSTPLRDDLLAILLDDGDVPA
ncbi:response regulator receiver protein [Amycolatopsis panacis]|uniref:Response regulator receiver protein n=1 Tax=Amycolatopsis panacis TaxID=2340917 RepID=A0A419I7H1_9PSEU|nr:response regulator receiver protein [Amycolatopsis panacis]RJQ87664.1 response regulator receiver protein [Amycolatopsis panacis]